MAGTERSVVALAWGPVLMSYRNYENTCHIDDVLSLVSAG